VTSRLTHNVKNIDDALSLARRELLNSKLAKKGDVFLFVGGIPFGRFGGTNMLIIQTV
jgi:pyruvate kinase